MKVYTVCIIIWHHTTTIWYSHNSVNCHHNTAGGDGMSRPCALQWRRNVRIGVTNHQPHECLLNCLFKAQIKENSKALRHWPLSGEFTGDFPAQRSSNAENVSIRWRHLGESNGMHFVNSKLRSVLVSEVLYIISHTGSYRNDMQLCRQIWCVWYFEMYSSVSLYKFHTFYIL